MNQTIITGRLTRDPEFRMTPSGKPVAQFALAVDRPFKNADGNREADFIPCVFWGKTAELVNQYLKKGNGALVSGRLQVRSYDDKQGYKRYVTEVIGERVEFLGSPATASKPQPNTAPADPPSFSDAVPFTEEIPF